jgi:H+/Cl- antiporter ClcA
MQLITHGLRDHLISGYTDYLNRLRKQLHTYSKRKRVLLLIVLLILPLGILWVFLIMKADQNLKNTLSKNGKGKRRFFAKENQN